MMEENVEKLLKDILSEVRREFQIPPYFSDEAIENYITEGTARLKSLNPVAKYEEDKTFQMLLKNYVYYAYHHKVNEWEENYASLILSWQLGSEVPQND